MINEGTFVIGAFISSSKNTDTELNVYVSDKHFRIDLLTVNFERSPSLLQEYLRHVKRQKPEYIPDDTDEDGEFEDPLEEMHEWILKPFESIFRAIAPLDRDRKYTLQDCLYADELHYVVEVVNGELVPVFIGVTKGERYKLIGAHLPSSTPVDYSMFPVYQPRESQVPIGPESTSLPAVPRKVFIPNQSRTAYFKTVYGSDARITLKELTAYSKIHKANFDDTVRTARLYGLVQDDEGYIMGLLLSYIDCDGSALYCAGADPEAADLRQKWMDQVSHTLKQLHSQGIVWEDAKAANVAVDTNDDTYIIDFGGGYTQGWVDKEKSNSLEGDLQGLERIKQYLYGCDEKDLGL